MNGVSWKPLIPLKSPPFPAKARSSHLPVSTINRTRKFYSISASNQQPQLNLSVLRFTLGENCSLIFSLSRILIICAFVDPGIPGFDESYLPRWIGYGFGSLILLNHFVGSDVNTITAAQLVRNLRLRFVEFMSLYWILWPHSILSSFFFVWLIV